MTQTYNNNESSEEIRADIQRTRGRMSENIDKIQHQLSPENLKLQAQETVQSVVQDSTTAITDYFKENSREIGAGMVDTIKRHPLPAALIGVGIGWLLVENYGSSEQSSSRTYGQQYRSGSYNNYQTPSPSASDRYWQESGDSYGYGPESTYQGSDRGNYSTQYYGDVDVQTTERMGNYASGYYSHEQQGSTDYRGSDYQGNIYQGSAYRSSESASGNQQEGRLQQAVDKVKDKASELGHQISEGAEQVRARAQETSHQIQDRVQQTGHQVQDQAYYARRRAEDQANAAQGNAQYYTEQARRQADRVGNQVQEYAQDAQYYAQQAGVQVQRSLHDNPLVFGGIALGIGALLGLALPSTRIENQTMGATSDQVKHSAEELGRDVQNRAQRVASEMQPKLEGIAHQVADDVKEAGRTAMHDLEDTGKTAVADLKQSGREAANELKDAASETQDKAAKEAEGTKETAKNEADKVKAQAQKDTQKATPNS